MSLLGVVCGCCALVYFFATEFLCDRYKPNVRCSRLGGAFCRCCPPVATRPNDALRTMLTGALCRCCPPVAPRPNDAIYGGYIHTSSNFWLKLLNTSSWFFLLLCRGGRPVSAFLTGVEWGGNERTEFDFPFRASFLAPFHASLQRLWSIVFPEAFLLGELSET